MLVGERPYPVVLEWLQEGGSQLVYVAKASTRITLFELYIEGGIQDSVTRQGARKRPTASNSGRFGGGAPLFPPNEPASIPMQPAGVGWLHGGWGYPPWGYPLQWRGAPSRCRYPPSRGGNSPPACPPARTPPPCPLMRSKRKCHIETSRSFQTM
jgi:hypothetical protein